MKWTIAATSNVVAFENKRDLYDLDLLLNFRLFASAISFSSTFD